jgi:hypothetical protein
MTIDAQGNVTDQCSGSLEWNPKLHLATQRTDQAWILEAALPLDELTDPSQLASECWQVAFSRSAPRSNRNLWTTSVPAGIEEPGRPFLRMREVTCTDWTSWSFDVEPRSDESNAAVPTDDGDSIKGQDGPEQK